LKILIITSEWPSEQRPNAVPFLVREVDQIKKMGIQMEVFSFRGNKRFKNYFESRKRLKKIIQNKKFDIIHVHWGYNAIILLPTNIPIVITYRGDDLNGISYMGGATNILKSFLVIIISKFVSFFASSIILVSQNFKVKLNENTPTFLIPSGIDLDLFKPLDKKMCRSLLKLDKNKKIILFAGNKTDLVKNYSLADKIVKIIKKSLINVVMISIPFNTDKELIPYYMNSADCLLFTSFQEGSPNVIKEALACNIPIVSADVGDVKDRLENIKGCIVCNSYNADEFASSVKEILDKEYKIDGRSNVLSLDLKNTAKDIIKVYKNIIDNDK
tara:strand:+ start:769 stop:1755 length:987 start_codon:yes stop_codon:yes gene_type:complete